jgi:hypothetical protein
MLRITAAPFPFSLLVQLYLTSLPTLSLPLLQTMVCALQPLAIKTLHSASVFL